MKKLTVVLLIAILVLSAGGLVAYATIEADQNNSTLPDTAFVGDVFDIIEYRQDGKTAKAYVRTPDGELYLTNKLSITQNGVYTVEYRIDDIVVKRHKVVVSTRPSNMFSVNKLANVAGKDTYSYLPDTEKFSGVTVDVNNGAEITFERTLEMTNRSKNDSLLKLLIKPDKSLVRDFGQVILTFTDVEDSSVYICVTLSAGDFGGNAHLAYVRAGANGQTAGGYEYRNGVTKFVTAEVYGTPCYFSFSGNCANQKNYKGNYDFGLDLRYDSDAKAFYVPSCVSSYGNLWLVADLDDANIFGANAWYGFPSGKAKLTVTFDRFVTKVGHVMFNEIDGIDLSADVINDIEPPKISVDLNGETKVSNSYVGAEYRVFDAVAYDFYDENCTVVSKVMYNANNGSEDWYDVSVKDGKFVTDKIGKYRIIYTSSDKSGNAATKQVEFVCLKDRNPIRLDNVPSDFSATVFDTVTLQSTGELTARGGNGKLKLSCNVTAPDGSEVFVQNEVFVPEQIGTYNVEYIATDYFGNAEKATVKLQVGGFSGAMFVSEPVLPQVLVSGFGYSLPEVKAIVCKDGSVSSANVKVYVDNEEMSTLKLNAPYDKDSVKIEYRAYETAESYTSFSQTVTVVHVDDGKNQAGYFFDKENNVTAVQNESSVDLSFNGNSSVFFANALNSSTFFAQFYYVNEKLNFASMTLKFTDVVNPEVTISVKIVFTPGGFTAILCNGIAMPFAAKEDAAGGYFAVNMNFAKGILKDINDKVVATTVVDDNGKTFEGFFDGVYVTMFFDGVKKASQINVNKINNQPLGHKNTAEDPIGDNVAPELVIRGDYNRKALLGDTLTVFAARSFDVLGQTKAVTVSVYDPQNKALLSNVPADKNYEVKLESVGRYRIIYVMTDIYGNKENGGATIVVADSVPPTLEVKANYKQVYRVGSTVGIPEFTVSDNLDNVYCDILVQLPSSEIRLLTHYANGETTSFLSQKNGKYPNSFKASDNSFVLETAGKYIITVIAYDDNYNAVYETFVLYAVELE